MAQLEGQAAVVADDSVDSAAAENDTAAASTEDQGDQDADDLAGLYPDDGAADAGEDDGSDEEEGADEEEGDGSDDKPEPIAPPQSWKAEEKAAFAKLPREIQETVTRREAERERFVQTKAQEVVQARQQFQQEALAHVQQISQQHIAKMQALLPEIPEEPPYRLQLEDPDLYAEIMDHRRAVIAQHQYVQQETAAIDQRVQAAQQTLAAIEAQRTHAVLSEKFPEYLDETDGPKLREELGSIAVELGYSAEQLAQVDATDILAMRTARDWKVKAAKWDALQSKRMSEVRKGKGAPPPRTARPGAAGSNRARAQKDVLAVLYPND